MQEISSELRGLLKTRQAFGMDQPDLPANDAEIMGMALAAHLLYDRLQARLPHCSEIEVLKFELATDMDHVSPEVRQSSGSQRCRC